MARKLVIMHIDGLGADSLEDALKTGLLPSLQGLMEAEGYEIHRYRCGVPSTTPFAQAGILYGDNTDIPSFRWWDRERGVMVQFGAGSTFKKVADKYFAGCEPLTRDGACIAACYPGGAADNFGIAYEDRTYGTSDRSRSAWSVLLPYIANPAHVGDWAWQTAAVLGRTAKDVVRSRKAGGHPARSYVLMDVVEEIFVHHLTRYAVQKAMREGYSPIYAGFYAFDETGHAFGPDDEASLRVLRQVDRSIARIAAARDGRYELVVLSDHGQIDTVPFARSDGRSFGAVLAEACPGYHVQEMKGKAFGPKPEDARGVINVTFSGGLAHIYFADSGRRLELHEVESRRAGLATDISRLGDVALVMAREAGGEVFFRGGAKMPGEAVKPVLGAYDDESILYAQLSRLNGFRTAGDLVVIGEFHDGKQVNFEDQAGGHGAIGGEQLHPFVLAKKEWGLDTSKVNGAHELHPILCDLRDRLAGKVT